MRLELREAVSADRGGGVKVTEHEKLGQWVTLSPVTTIEHYFEACNDTAISLQLSS